MKSLSWSLLALISASVCCANAQQSSDCQPDPANLASPWLPVTSASSPQNFEPNPAVPISNSAQSTPPKPSMFSKTGSKLTRLGKWLITPTGTITTPMQIPTVQPMQWAQMNAPTVAAPLQYQPIYQPTVYNRAASSQIQAPLPNMYTSIPNAGGGQTVYGPNGGMVYTSVPNAAGGQTYFGNPLQH